MHKAKITITVPYDQIPHEAEVLIAKCTTRMYKIIEDFKTGPVEDIQKTLKDIEKAREKLVMVDANLEDAYYILLGYLKNEIDSKLPPQEEEIEEIKESEASDEP